jgi:hypothetical protein
MARLKVLVFSLVVLALWGAQLHLLSPALGTRALEQAQAAVSAAPAAVAARVESRRALIARAAASAASNAEVATAVRLSRGDAPSPALIQQVRGYLAAEIPEPIRPTWFVAVATLGGALGIAGAEGEVGPVPDELDVEKLTAAGVGGAVRTVGGVPHLFVAVPVETSERDGVKLWGHVLVGAALVTSEVFDSVVRDANLPGVALVQSGEVLFAAGPKAALARKAVASAGDRLQIVERGSVAALGPAQLPLLTSADVMGGQAPLWAAARASLDGLPLEVVHVASLVPVMTALADYQQVSLILFGVLAALGLFFVAIAGGAKKQAAVAVAPAPVAEPRPTPSAPLPLAEASEPEATPDDFPFGAPAPQSPEPAAQAEAAADPFGAYQAAPAEEQTVPPVFGEGQPWPSGEDPHAPSAQAQPFPEPAPFEPPAWEPPAYDQPAYEQPAYEPPAYERPAQGGLLSSDLDDEPPTRAAGLDASALFSAAEAGQHAGSNPFDPPGDAWQASPAPAMEDFNPEATRVSPVSPELLQAAARAADPEFAPASPPAFAPPPVQATFGTADAEEGHFQEVYRDFLQTRESCGEGAEGLTYDKFAQKLRKNREQLLVKYACRTVRFQVYVKEGKAALKATPVKD